MSAKKDPWQFTIRFNQANAAHRQAAEFLNQCGHFKAQCIAEAMEMYLRRKRQEAAHIGQDAAVQQGEADTELLTMEQSPPVDEPVDATDNKVDEPVDVTDSKVDTSVDGSGIDGYETEESLGEDDIAAILKSMGMFGDED